MDRDWRVHQWGLHEDSCENIGCCFSDLLLHPPYSTQELQPQYDVDILDKKVVLLSISWHYGRIVSENRDRNGLFPTRTGMERDMTLLGGILDTITEANASCILCLHDKKRYEPQYLKGIAEVASRYDDVMVKHKSDHPDNLSDLLVSDVMVSNLSSYITFFYHLGRPSIHILPAGSQTSEIQLAQIRGGRFGYRRVKGDEPLWMNDPTDNGGLTVRSLDETRNAILQGLEDPDCCKERSAEWISRHIHRPDGHTAERFHAAIQALARPSCAE
jgi:hypothetical protein